MINCRERSGGLEPNIGSGALARQRLRALRQLGPWAGLLTVMAVLMVLLVPGSGCGGSPPSDSCEPTTCAAQGRTCGSLEDGCGGVLVCGLCDAPNQVCDAAEGVCACEFEACDGMCCDEDQRCQAGQCVARGFLGVDLLDASAPDEYTVLLRLSGDPGAELAEDLSRYSLQSPLGDLVVEAVSYDDVAREVTLTTSRQKLGVTYSLTVDRSPDEASPLAADVLAADTAGFWVTDFSDPYFGDYWVVADRVGVSDTAVAYVEQGLAVSGTSSALADFDDLVYPTLTGQLIAAPDFDGNERIVLLGLDGEGYYGGYFSPTNQYKDSDTMAWWGRHSNEMEIVHVNAVYGDWMMQEVVSHEFGHLLYHERHGLQQDSWDYHDEGLAEVCVHLVYGVNQQSMDYFFSDPQGVIGDGLSLVHWTWGQYDNYALAYMWWVYLASRAGGLGAISQIFNLPDGNPTTVEGWIAQELGGGFSSAQRDFMLATWIKAPAGPYGYEGLLDLSAQPDPSTVSSGTSSLSLPPFGAAFFRLASASVDYPGTQGADVLYVGIDGASTVDATAPFDVDGGALLVLNTSESLTSSETQPSGPDLPALLPPPAPGGVMPARFLDPPPVSPERITALRAWRSAALARMARQGWQVPAR